MFFSETYVETRISHVKKYVLEKVVVFLCYDSLRTHLI